MIGTSSSDNDNPYRRQTLSDRTCGRMELASLGVGLISTSISCQRKFASGPLAPQVSITFDSVSPNKPRGHAVDQQYASVAGTYSPNIHHICTDAKAVIITMMRLVIWYHLPMVLLLQVPSP